MWIINKPNNVLYSAFICVSSGAGDVVECGWQDDICQAPPSLPLSPLFL